MTTSSPAVSLLWVFEHRGGQHHPATSAHPSLQGKTSSSLCSNTLAKPFPGKLAVFMFMATCAVWQVSFEREGPNNIVVLSRGLRVSIAKYCILPDIESELQHKNSRFIILVYKCTPFILELASFIANLTIQAELPGPRGSSGTRQQQCPRQHQAEPGVIQQAQNIPSNRLFIPLDGAQPLLKDDA